MFLLVDLRICGIMGEPTFDIPAEGIAAVVRDEGENFWVEVIKKPVPEVGMYE